MHSTIRRDPRLRSASRPSPNRVQLSGVKLQDIGASRRASLGSFFSATNLNETPKAPSQLLLVFSLLSLKYFNHDGVEGRKGNSLRHLKMYLKSRGTSDVCYPAMMDTMYLSQSGRASHSQTKIKDLATALSRHCAQASDRMRGRGYHLLVLAATCMRSSKPHVLLTICWSSCSSPRKRPRFDDRSSNPCQHVFAEAESTLQCQRSTRIIFVFINSLISR